MNDADARRRVVDVEERLAALDDDRRALAALHGLVELYGEGLRRIVAAGGVTEELAGDELVSHLLLIHDLHPIDVETRVVRALEEVRPYLGSHGGDVELLGVEGGVAHLRLNGTCDGCPSSRVTLQQSIETAILRAAPELERVEADGLAPGPTLLQIAPGPCLPAGAP